MSFGSSYDREAAHSEERWRGWAARDAAGDDWSTLLALRGDEPVGMVMGVRDEEAETFDVFAMWVAPEARGQGLGRRLLGDLEAWIRSVGGRTVRLSVTDRAEAAAALYRSAGYEPDGRRDESRHTPGLVEIHLRKRLV